MIEVYFDTIKNFIQQAERSINIDASDLMSWRNYNQQKVKQLAAAGLAGLLTYLAYHWPHSLRRVSIASRSFALEEIVLHDHKIVHQLDS